MTVIKEIGADAIALQEVDQRFGNRTSLLDLNALEQESGLVPIPLRGVRSNHGWRGNLVLVRDGTVTATRQLVLPGAEPRGALIVDLALPSIVRSHASRFMTRPWHGLPLTTCQSKL